MRTTAKRHQHFDSLNELGETIAFPCSGADRAFLFAKIGITHDTLSGLIVSTSASGPFHSIAHALKFCNDPIPMVALNFDPAILDRSTRAKPCFQLGGKLRDTVLIQGQIGNDCHSFASSPICLSAHSDDGGLVRSRWLALTSACALQLVTLGTKEIPPIVLSHRVVTFSSC